MTVTLEEMKLYLRVDEDLEDDLIESFIKVAEEYIFNATGKKFDENAPETAKLIVKLLVSHWYENRAITTNQPSNLIDFSVRSLLSQIEFGDMS
ncbi:head-tail connector protein [Priestia koreensis]|uniref:head-tail connector protein n=1 Tax=Priestia koreensis TaxID=284581 RepID=UPI003D02D92A